ncbi:hypothetical protein JT06_03555 [Desulfobulbus sp. Tol-SR]|nr:hypothetical protein JT06_03555 [Desulfobulbus sp. Tol-SR]
MYSLSIEFGRHVPAIRRTSSKETAFHGMDGMTSIMFRRDRRHDFVSKLPGKNLLLLPVCGELCKKTYRLSAESD